jgi:hypothetical protein
MRVGMFSDERDVDDTRAALRHSLIVCFDQGLADADDRSDVACGTSDGRPHWVWPMRDRKSCRGSSPDPTSDF